MSSFETIKEQARVSWICNTTTRDGKWRIKQLHGLYKLLLENRDELIGIMMEENSLSALMAEREIAMVVDEIATHISDTLRPEISISDTVRHGATSIIERPYGILCILNGKCQPMRHVLAPLASAIAAGNIIILAAVSKEITQLFALLVREIPNYMDPFSIHALTGLDITRASFANIDHVAIFDDSSEEYGNILSKNNAAFYSTRSSFNVVIIDEGKKSWPKVIQELKNNAAPATFYADAISAFFVRESEFEEFTSYWRQSSANELPLQAQPTNIRLMSYGCTLLSPNTYQFRLAGIKTGLEPNKLSDIMIAAKEANSLVVIQFTSIDQVLDALATTCLPVKQMTLLSPASEKSMIYFEKWSSSEYISIGHFRSLVPAALNDFRTPTIKELRMFPITTFSRPRAILSGAKSSRTVTEIPALRREYETKISPLKPEPRGERTDFFVQAGYLFKGIQITAALVVLLSLWHGGKTISRRL